MRQRLNLPLYLYQTLHPPEHVRVLVLQPARESNEDLKVGILQYDRSKNRLLLFRTPVCEAVSYLRGENSVFSSELSCNGSTKLTFTLDVDLKRHHFRRPTELRFLWIDAICLNQVDEHERSERILARGGKSQGLKSLRFV